MIKDSKVVNNSLFNEFDYIDYFREENFSEDYRVAKVIINGKYGLINRKFEVVLHPKYDNIQFITHPNYLKTHPHYQKKSLHLALVTTEGKSGLINRHGHFIVKPVHQGSSYEVYDCLEYGDKAGTLYEIMVGSKWGLINSDGDIIIEPKYDFITKFRGGFAVVGIGNKQGIIDDVGREIIEPRIYEYIDSVTSGLKREASYKVERKGAIAAILFGIYHRTLLTRGENSWIFSFRETIDLGSNIVKQ